MICRFCGKEIADDSNFCGNCGNILNQSAQQPFSEQKIINYEKRSITLGIIGIITSFILSVVGCITSGFGIYYGIKEYKYTKKICGLILSSVGMLFSVIATLIGFVILDFILTLLMSFTTTFSAINDSIYIIKSFLSSLNNIGINIADLFS